MFSNHKATFISRLFSLCLYISLLVYMGVTVVVSNYVKLLQYNTSDEIKTPEE